MILMANKIDAPIAKFLKTSPYNNLDLVSSKTENIGSSVETPKER